MEWIVLKKMMVGMGNCCYLELSLCGMVARRESKRQRVGDKICAGTDS